MTKRLFFAAMMCCMVICSLAFVACSDDDDSGSETNGGDNVTTRVCQDGVEGVMQFFYDIDTLGNKTLIMGTTIGNAAPTICR